MDKTYTPNAIEKKWYETWEKAGYFKPQFAPDSGKKNYSIVIPPPNVTGSLHMGHAFINTIQDCLIRYHRMLGENTLWQAGTDHAGIATQMVVERDLALEGKNRHELGREAFIKRVWDWKNTSGGQITAQLRRLGASPDWERERFTMDDGLSNAVKEVFVSLYEQGLIYRGKRLVNWDPKLETALSDLEVENHSENGHLWHFRYTLADGQTTADGKDYLVVATTRPETLLGDTAVAVHPDDERYAHLVGKHVILPITGRVVPIVADEYVEKAFGTGCVKITPAHDFNDYELGKRHQLPLINIFDKNACVLPEMLEYANTQTRDPKTLATPEDFAGLERFAARKHLLKRAEAEGFLDATEKHQLNLPYGDRSGVIVEPWLTDQWYVAIKPLAEPAIAAVEKGEIKFVPAQYENMYMAWMKEIQDWCISRQLWWGHRIPAWYDEQGNHYVGRDEAEVRAKYQLADKPLKQDEDVLDTWFSSALWTFSTMGFADKADDGKMLAAFHPTSVLVTGFDIIFFWVARMIMMTMHFMKNPDGSPQVPFKEVFVTGLVRDEFGAKMSKSKGNVLDPLDMIDGIDLEALVEKRTSHLMNPKQAASIEKNTRKTFPNGIAAHGTDALRFTVAALASNGRDINWDMQRLEGYRNFCNKIWNAARFVLMKTENFDIKQARKHSDFDAWIEARFMKTAQQVEKHFADYRFDLIAKTIYEFVWNDYCDWYLELSKVALNSEDAAEVAGTQYTLLTVLEKTMRLIHPLMPFISEEIWQTLKQPLDLTGETVMLAAFPSYDETAYQAIDKQAIAATDWLCEVLSGIRKIRSEMNIAPSKSIDLFIENASEQDKTLISRFTDALQKMAKLTTITVATGNIPESAVYLVGDMKLHIPLKGLIDKTAELARLQKEISKLEVQLARLDAQLGNAQFVQNAPAELVEKTQQEQAMHQKKHAELTAQIEKIALL